MARAHARELGLIGGEGVDEEARATEENDLLRRTECVLQAAQRATACGVERAAECARAASRELHERPPREPEKGRGRERRARCREHEQRNDAHRDERLGRDRKRRGQHRAVHARHRLIGVVDELRHAALHEERPRHAQVAPQELRGGHRGRVLDAPAAERRRDHGDGVLQ